MTITEVNVVPVKPKNGLVGFASLVVDGNIYLNSIAIYVKLDDSYRLLYPTKKTGMREMNVYHPINREASKFIEHAVFEKCFEIFESSNHDELRFRR